LLRFLGCVAVNSTKHIRNSCGNCLEGRIIGVILGGDNPRFVYLDWI